MEKILIEILNKELNRMAFVAQTEKWDKEMRDINNQISAVGRLYFEAKDNGDEEKMKYYLEKSGELKVIWANKTQEQLDRIETMANTLFNQRAR